MTEIRGNTTSSVPLDDTLFVSTPKSILIILIQLGFLKIRSFSLKLLSNNSGVSWTCIDEETRDIHIINYNTYIT